MDTTTWIDAWGVTIHAPVTAGTNLALSLLCGYCALSLREAGGDRRKGWARFFAAMSVATLAGVPKHGLWHLLGAGELASLLWTSNLASGAAVYFAQKATIASRTPLRARRSLERVVWFQAALFLAANLVLGPEMLLLIAYSAVGLVPVIVVEVLALRRGDEHGGWVASGLVLSLLTALVYVFQLSLGRWFNHVDVAHTLMGVSFYLILRGAPNASRARGDNRRTRRSAYARRVSPRTLAPVGRAGGAA